MALSAGKRFLREVRSLLIACLAWTLTGCAVSKRETPAPVPPSAESLDAAIDPANFDASRLALAIFHETNRVRGQLGLPLFRWLPKLNEAAKLEAAVGKVYQPPSHTNPFPMIGTPAERVRFVGLVPGDVAENIAWLTIYDVPTRVGVIVSGGQKHFVDPGTQAELRRATYRGFATNVVQAWMDSPAHRVNLTNAALRYLGCGVQPGLSLLGADQLFCVQVFFTPQR